MIFVVLLGIVTGMAIWKYGKIVPHSDRVFSYEELEKIDTTKMKHKTAKKHRRMQW